VLISGAVADLEVMASGIGYAAAGITGGTLAIALTLSPFSPARLNPATLLHLSRDAFARLTRIGLPVGLEEAQFMFAFLIYTRIVSSLGTEALAAHALALRSLEIGLLPGFALGTAATALVARYLGAGDTAMAEQVARRVQLFGTVVLLAMASLQFVLAPHIVGLFVDDPDVAHTGTTLLRIFAFALPAVGTHATLSGALRGAGDVRYVLMTLTITAWGVRVPLAAFLVLALGLTVPFAWVAAAFEHYVRAAMVLARFRTGRWKTMRV
jgi:Na+-driven multidrug efflux pump